MADPVACQHCGQVIVCDPDTRTPTSAWTAPAAEDPTACASALLGHTPTEPPAMRLWLVYDDDRPDHRLGLIPGTAVGRTTRSLDDWTAAARTNAAAGLVDAGGRYELRPTTQTPT